MKKITLFIGLYLFCLMIKAQTTSYNVIFRTNSQGVLSGTRGQVVEHGSDATPVTAIPNDGFVFLEWQDRQYNRLSTDNPLTVTNVVSDSVLIAAYKIDGFDIRFKTDGNGTISGNAVQIIPEGEATNPVTASPYTGYVFKEWRDGSDNTFSTDNPLTITNVTQELTLTAIFELDKYTVTFTTSEGGTLTGSTEQTITHGTDATALTAVPASGYTFIKWSHPDGTVLSSDNPFTLEGVTKDMEIEAVFCKTLTNTTWTKSNSPYMIKSDILIPNNVTLTIEPGVEVILAGKYSIGCEGTILSKGTAQDNIIFTPQDKTNMWYGIKIKAAATNDSTIFSYTRIEYSCQRAITLNNTDKVRVSNCVFSNNSAPTGGGIYLDNSDVLIINNVFKNNKATSSGGGVHANNSEIRIIGNLFIDNYGDLAAGALYFYYVTFYAINNTFVGNSAGQQGGAGELNESSRGYFYNNVYWGNSARLYGNNWYYWESHGYYYNEAIEGGNATSSIDLNGYFLQSSATYGGGSFDATCINLSSENTGALGPNFVDPDNDMYTFTGDSPLKNKGTVSSISGYLPGKDLFGNTRIQESVIDIGASEYTTYTLTVNSTTGGSVSGSTNQVIGHGASSDTIKAVADENYYFVEWQDASGNSLSTDIDFTYKSITENTTITAIFAEIIYFSVSFSAEEGGSIYGDTIQTVAARTDATEVTAIAADGYSFVEWRNAIGDSITSVNPITVEHVLQDSSLIAIFEVLHYTVSISAGENGSITPMGDSLITVNDTIHCIITPATDYVINNLTYNGESVVDGIIDNNDGSYSYDIVSVSEDVAFVVTFTEYVEFTITSSAGAHGGISPEGDTIIHSTFAKYEFTPDEGYIISKVLVDDISVPFVGNSYVFNALTEDHTISVEFKEFEGVLSLYPEMDASIWYKKGVGNEAKANTNYGPNENLYLLDSEWGSRDYMHIVMHFSEIQEVLNSINISNLGDTIESIKLNLYHYPSSDAPFYGSNSFHVYWYNNDWEETTITWNNAPAFDEDPSYVWVASSTSAEQDYSIDITDMFLSNYEETGGEAGFRLKLAQGSSGSRQQAYFASKEYGDIAYAPYLKLNFKGFEHTAINNLKLGKLQIFPNPATGIINISTLKNKVENAVLTVHSITGEVVYYNPVFNGEPVDLSALQEGVYIVKLNSDGYTYQEKLIKR